MSKFADVSPYRGDDRPEVGVKGSVVEEVDEKLPALEKPGSRSPENDEPSKTKESLRSSLSSMMIAVRMRE